MKLQWKKYSGAQKLTQKHLHTWRSKIFVLALMLILVSACKSPKYLPPSTDIDINEYGSLIEINNWASVTFKGELISVDSSSMVILNQVSNECMTAAFKDIKYFSLRYAKPKHYGWTIPVFAIPSFFMHGFQSVVTIPINLILTIAATATGENAYKYNEQNLSFEDLRMFARFPQGIPPHIDIKRIRHSIPEVQ